MSGFVCDDVEAAAPPLTALAVLADGAAAVPHAAVISTAPAATAGPIVRISRLIFIVIFAIPIKFRLCSPPRYARFAKAENQADSAAPNAYTELDMRLRIDEPKMPVIETTEAGGVYTRRSTSVNLPYGS
ncbi:MAG TPA: hypothetical protein VH442_08010 [Micromonosporaceae bacterium]